MSADPTRPLPEWWQTQGQGPAEPPTFVIQKKRRRKGPLIALITVIVILVLLVVSDRVANAYAERTRWPARSSRPWACRVSRA